MARSATKRRSGNAPSAASSARAAAALACLVVMAAATFPAAAAACKAQPGPAGSTDDLVTTWSSPCDAGGNADCRACFLWTGVVQRAKKPLGKYVYSSTSTNGGQVSTYRAKILPTAALQGIESIAGKQPASDKLTYDLWSTALGDLIAGKVPGVKAANFPVAMINSLNARSQHQMHVHVGRPQSGAGGAPVFYECIRNAGWTKSPPTAKAWRTIPAGKCDNLPSRSNAPVKLMATTSTAAGVNGAIRAGFSRLTKDMTADAAAQRTAVLVQPDPKGTKGQYLVVLITGSGVNDYSIFGDKP